MKPGFERASVAPATPNGSPDGYGELTVERLRLLVKTISYEAARRAFDAEETLVEGRAGSEESEREMTCSRAERCRNCQHC